MSAGVDRRKRVRESQTRLVKVWASPDLRRAMEDRRTTKRQRVLKAVSIQVGGGGAIDCTVRKPIAGWCSA